MSPAATITPLRVCTFTQPMGSTGPEVPGDLFAFLVRGAEATVLVDTGVGTGHAGIDQRFGPARVDLLALLREQGVAAGALDAIVCTHLHFDHCGNNGAFPGVPIYVQRREHAATRSERYTVSDWVNVATANYVLLDGAFPLTADIAIVPTPGHTAGHQSVVVQTARGTELIVGQAAYTAAEFESYRLQVPPPGDNASDVVAYQRSLQKLHVMAPRRAYFSHDATVWAAPA